MIWEINKETVFWYLDMKPHKRPIPESSRSSWTKPKQAGMLAVKSDNSQWLTLLKFEFDDNTRSSVVKYGAKLEAADRSIIEASYKTACGCCYRRDGSVVGMSATNIKLKKMIWWESGIGNIIGGNVVGEF